MERESKTDVESPVMMEEILHRDSLDQADGGEGAVIVDGCEAVKLSPAASARWKEMAPIVDEEQEMSTAEPQVAAPPLVSVLRPRRFRSASTAGQPHQSLASGSITFEPQQHYVRYIESFDILEQVGSGMFGQVHRARDRETGEIVATKKIRLDNEREGFPVTALREIKILQHTNHVNLVKLKEIVSSRASDFNRSRGSVFLVFEYCPFDLTALLACQDVPLLETHIMCIMKQILVGLHYAHTNSLLHRDIKPANILITANGVVKIADWGLSRVNKSTSSLTNRVCTLWYRAPELLLGQVDYNASVDMWSTGCLFLELWVRRAVLQGHCEVSQLSLIFNLFGSPTQENWPGWEDLPLAKTLDLPCREPKFEERFSRIRPEAKQLILGLLTLDPAKRLTALGAADHAYFWDNPEVQPCAPEELPLPKHASLHEWNFKSSNGGAIGGYNQPPPHDPSQHHHHQRVPMTQGSAKRVRRAGGNQMGFMNPDGLVE